MKVIMYMAITANGMIAKTNDNTSWISEEEWNCYSQSTQKARCLIVGRRTYNILTEQPEFSELKDVKLVVVTSQKINLKQDNHHIASSPLEALKILSDFNEVIVAGGGILNAAFLNENLVDELFLDVEPIILGKGIPLFNGQDFEIKLNLIGQNKITENELQLHYKVVKK